MIHKFKVGDILELKHKSKHIAFKGIVIRLIDPSTINRTPRVRVRVLCDKDTSLIGKELNLNESAFRLSIEAESIPLPSIPN